MSGPMLVTFSVYILSMIGIGGVAYYRTKSFDDYILGGRSIGSFVTALSAGASDMSAWLLMGFPGAVYMLGLRECWIALGLVIGAYLNWHFVAGRLRVHTEVNDNALTLPDYFASRFDQHKRLIRLCSASVILIFFTIYCSSGIVAGARLFQSTFGFTYSEGIWLGAFATVTYTFLGGFLAVSWTDTVQASLMLFAMIFTPIMILVSLGGLDSTLSTLQAHSASHLNLFNDVHWLSIISLMGWGVGYLGQPHILARFMAADSHHTIVTAKKISITWMILCFLGAIAIGLFGRAFFYQHASLAGAVNVDNEKVFIELTKVLFNPWLAGILLSAILAAVMSTLSCQLLVSSSAITEDLYKAFLRPKASTKELVWVGRCMVLVVAAVSIFIACNPNNKVLGLVSYAWAGFGAAFGPVILFSVFWSRMSSLSALLGMLAGSMTVIIWKHYHWFNFYELIPGFVAASVTIVLANVFSKGPSERMKERFNLAKQQFSQ